MILILLLAQAAWNDGLETALAKARENSSPILAVWVDGEAPSKTLLKRIEESPQLRKLAWGFTLAKINGEKPASLLDLPLPLVAVLEPALLRREDLATLPALLAASRARLTVAGEFSAADDALVAAIRKTGRGGSLRIGPMPLKDCFSVVGGWTAVTLKLPEIPLVLDPAVPADASIEFDAGADHTFHSILRAMAKQNGLVLYPRGGKIVLSPRIPAAEIDPAALGTLMAAHAEPEANAGPEGAGIQKAIRDLGDDDLATRDAAVKTLREAGVRARRDVRKALLDSREADLRSRLEQILRP